MTIRQSNDPRVSSTNVTASSAATSSVESTAAVDRTATPYILPASPVSRRQMLAALIASGFAAAAGVSQAAPQKPPQPNRPANTNVRGIPTPASKKEAAQVDFRSILKTHSATRNRLVMELKGQVRLTEASSSAKTKERTAEIEATSTLDYEESLTPADPKNTRSVRYYHEARVDNRVAKTASVITLRDDCKKIVCRKIDDVNQMACVDNSLYPTELQLLQVPSNSLAFPQLLPTAPVSIGDTWKIPDTVLAELLNIYAIQQQQVVAKFASIEDGKANIEIDGTVQGSALAVPTSIEFNSKLQIDLKIGEITWFAIGLKERRDIGKAEPGFDITARIRLIRKPLSAPEQTAAAKQWIAKLDANPASMLLEIDSSASRYKMLATREWRVITENSELAILRMVQDNKTIAQCNITNLPPLGEGKQLTLDAYQAEVQRTLGDNFGQFVEANERLTPSKLRELRVVAAGTAADVPIQWIYIHLSDDTGRRTSMAYTMFAEFGEKFGGADVQMSGTFSYTGPAPTPSSAPKEAAPKESPAIAKSAEANSDKSLFRREPTPAVRK